MADNLLKISQQFPLLEKVELALGVRNDFDRSVRILANGCPKLKYFAFKFTQKEKNH